MKTKIRSYSPPGEAGQGRKERWQRCRWLGLLVAMMLLGFGQTAKAANAWEWPKFSSKDLDVTPDNPFMAFQVSYLNYDGNNFYWKSFNLVVDGVNIGSIGSIVPLNSGTNDDAVWNNKTGWVGNYWVEFRSAWQGDGKWKYVTCHVYIPNSTYGQVHTVGIEGDWVDKNRNVRHITPDNLKITSNAVNFTTPNGCGSYERTAPGKITWKPSNSVTAPTNYNHKYEFRLEDVGNWMTNSNPNANYVLSGVNDSEEQAYHTRYILYRSLTYNNRTINVTFTRDWQKNVSGNIVKACVSPKEFKTSFDQWKKTTSLTWKKEDSNRLTNGKFYVFRYKNGDTSTREKLGVVDYSSSLQFVDDNFDYDNTYIYEVSSILDTWNNNAPVADLTATSQEISTTPIYNYPTFTDERKESSVRLSWMHDKPSNNTAIKFKVWRCLDSPSFYDESGQLIEDNIIAAMGDPYVTDISASTAGETSFEDTNISSSCSFYWYRIGTDLFNRTFYSKLLGPTSMNGSTVIKSITANRGTYSNVVKVQWDVKQMGTSPSRFVVSRRLLGSTKDADYQQVYVVSGTESSYFFEDKTVQPGQFYQYSVVSQSNCVDNETGQTTYNVTSKGEADGFCQSRGIISGRITYGTGTAVPNAYVLLKKNSEDDDDAKQFYSMKVDPQGGILWTPTATAAKGLFEGMAFTLQLYVRPDAVLADGSTIIDGGGNFAVLLKPAGETGKSEVYVQVGSGEPTATGVTLTNEEFTNVSVTCNGTTDWTVRAIDKSGTLTSQTVTATAVTWTGSEGVAFGCDRGFTSEHSFTGYLDDIRLWSKVLTDDELLDNYDRLLIGSEQGLKLYWPMDEGVSSLPFAYDYSKTSGVANENHGQRQPNTSFDSKNIPSDTQLRLYGKTDEQGNYVIRGIPFTGEGTSYMVRPTLGIHAFSPQYQTRFVNEEALTHNGVDFEDVSSFPVSGTIYYSNTDYPVEGVNLYVDGTICAKDGKAVTTDAKGKFTISVPIGDHYITVGKQGHTFYKDGRYPDDDEGIGKKFTFDRTMTGLDFYDNTLVTVAGRVVGGDTEGKKPLGMALSKNNIGRARVTLSLQEGNPYRLNVVKVVQNTTSELKNNPNPLNVSSPTTDVQSTAYRTGGPQAIDVKSIVIETDPATGEFAVQVPPLLYKVTSVEMLNSNAQASFAKVTFSDIDATDPLMEYTDSTDIYQEFYHKEFKYNARLAQSQSTFYCTPTFQVWQDGRDDGLFGDDKATYYNTLANEAEREVKVDAIANGTYVFGYPLFEQNKEYKFRMKAYEQYINSDDENNVVTTTVPLKNALVTINNMMSSDRKVVAEACTIAGVDYRQGEVVSDEVLAQYVQVADNQLQLNEKGEATYTWSAGFPNIYDDLTLPLSISYEYNNRTNPWTDKPLEGIIIGALPSGSNFVTAGPDKVTMILRDPAGTGSSAKWEKGSSHSRVDTNTVTTSSDDVINTVTHFGVELENAAGGIAFYNIQKMETKRDFEVGLEMNYTYEGTHTTTTTTTTTKAISTSSEPDFVGADGDVFIGTSTNLLFGNARQVLVKKAKNGTYSISSEDGLMTSTQFDTEFSYTQHYIENTLIPNLVKLRNKLLQTVDASTYDSYKNPTNEVKYITKLDSTDVRFGSDNNDKTVWGADTIAGTFVKGPSYHAVIPTGDSDKLYQDMVHYYNESIRNWKEQLALNEKQKLQVINDRQSYLINNFSFDGGTSVEHSTGTEEVKDSVWSNSYSIHLVAGTKGGLEINKTGVEVTLQTNTGSGQTFVDEEHGTTSESFSFSLVESGDDALSVDVFNSPDDFAPIFVTRGGQTSCPYEDETVTKYYQPGTSIGAATMKMEDPKLSVVGAKNVLSDVPRGGKAVFQLKLENMSETNSDGQFNLKLVEDTNPNGAKLSLSTGPLGNGHTFIVKSGEALTIPLTLEQNNTDVYDYEDIGLSLQSDCQSDLESVVYITAHFVPSSSNVTLMANKNVLNTSVGDVLTLSVRDYDANYENLKAIRVQYKGERDVNWSTIPGEEYYVDKQYATANSQPLPKGGIITVQFPMEDYVDGTYLFRAQTATAYGNDEITKESDVVTVIKDMKKPQLFGNANPSDGVLNAGDEISLTFNEDIRQSMLTETNNFKITAALNGQQVAHSVALDGQATECAAKTEANINLANKDFSMDMWVKFTGAGTLLSHGNGAEKMDVSTDASGHLVVKIGEETYTSGKAITPNKWVFLTLNYQTTKNGGVLNAMFAEDDTQTMLFTDKDVVAYEGNGALAVGKQMTGAIHELTLWDKARSCADAQAEMNYTKKPSTPNLIGYWKFDEGEGLKATDYARNRHMTLAGQTWYVNNENKAVTLSGTNAVKLNISECSALPTEDYALELWFKSNQTTKATLFSTGSSEQAVEMGFNDSGALTLTSKGITRQLTTNNYRNNAWHHVALNVLRNGNATVYVDGTPVNSMPASAVASLAGSDIVVGASKIAAGEYANYFKGSVDEVRFWKATLTGDYLNRQKSTRLTGEEDGLVAYYPFEHKELDGANQVVTTASAADQRKVYNKKEDIYELTGHEATMTTGSITYSATDVPRLKEAPTVTNIGFNFVANERSIVINLIDDADRLEGTTVDFVVKAVLDANGNESTPVSWTAYIRQNSLLWKGDTEVSVEKMVGETATFEATITNESGNSENWSLSGLPSWLTASATNGTLKATMQKTITFTVAESTAPGKYEQTIYLTGNSNIAEPLTLNLKVKSEEPLWTVNTSNYEESMNVIGSLQIIGVPSQDEDDIVGAFIGNECRGVARPKYMQKFDGYFVTMDIYGSGSENSQPVELKVFDASTGIIYPVVKTYKPGESTASTLTFEANTLQGRYTTPLRFDVTDEIEQNIELAKGWNWMSLSVRPGETPSDMTTNVVFAKADGKVKTVKGQAGSATYSGGSWISNSLTTMTNADMYTVNSSEAFVLNVTGHRVNPAETPVTVKNGWNWVGYCGQQVVSVADALATMTPTDGDIIKGQKGVAYFDGSEWNGSLQTLVPGKGYKLQSAASANRTLYYPTTTAAGARMLDDERVTPKVFEAVDYSNYPANMVVIAKVVKNGMPMAFAELGVFAGSECREAAVTDGQGMAYITVPGDNSTKLTFRVVEDEKVFNAREMVNYATDAVVGTPHSPFVIDLGTATAVGFVATESQQTEQVFDLQGRKVKVDDQTRKLRKGVYIVNGQKQVK